MVFVTDVDGILLDVKNDKIIVNHLTVDKAENLMAKGFIDGGMLSKLKNCVSSIKNGVSEVVIINSKIKYSLVTNFITPQKISTTICK